MHLWDMGEDAIIFAGKDIVQKELSEGKGDWTMVQIFMTSLLIHKVRHLEDIYIPLAEDRVKHLILTGKNGSGKTSVLEALADFLNDSLFLDQGIFKRVLAYYAKLSEMREGSDEQDDEVNNQIRILKERFFQEEKDAVQDRKKIEVKYNFRCGDYSTNDLVMETKPVLVKKGNFILAFYKADRAFVAEQPKHVEKVQFKEEYGPTEFPRNEFVKYLLDLKMTEALARNSQKNEKADEISGWFANLEQLLKEIFEDESLKLTFDEDTFEFHVLQQGREPFDFNTLSDGYQAVLDIVLDIMMRMVSQTGRSLDFNLPGIVLIDEIETHLHLELQKNIMPLLTTLFPNIQFVVTTHSPFILSSLENAVIYDLENHILVEEGMNNLPYEGIVEGYFEADRLSDTLKEKYERYRSLVRKKTLSDDEISEIAKLELYLDEIPDYLAIGFTTEYRRLKLEYMNREDIV